MSRKHCNLYLFFCALHPGHYLHQCIRVDSFNKIFTIRYLIWKQYSATASKQLRIYRSEKSKKDDAFEKPYTDLSFKYCNICSFILYCLFIKSIYALSPKLVVVGIKTKFLITRKQSQIFYYISFNRENLLNVFVNWV